jgi:cell division protein FtsL
VNKLVLAKEEYSYSSAAYEVKKPAKVKEREVTVNNRKAKMKVKAIMAVMVFLALSLVILLRYCEINEYNQRITKLKLESQKIAKSNTQLQIDLDNQVDIGTIEKLAVERLGMQHPDKNQIVYVELKKSDYTKVPEQAIEESAQNKSVVKIAFQQLMNVIEYLY